MIFQEKCSSCYSPNFIIWLPLLLLGNRCIAIVYVPGYDIINFEIYLIFLIKRFLYMTKKSRTKELSTLVRIRWGQNSLSYQFFPPVTFKNITLLSHWCKISRPYVVPIPNYLTWTKHTPPKNIFFPAQTLVSYDNFFHRNARVTKFRSHDHIYNITWVTW